MQLGVDCLGTVWYTLGMIRNGVNEMLKTVNWKAFNGIEKVTEYRLDKHNVGQANEYWAILYQTIDGTPAINKWGGYHSRNVGKPAYIKKIWNNM
tara:strand:+ start:297 stop:581 length:285 start_codon:yes stop_codon:yes gene_type:complete